MDVGHVSHACVKYEWVRILKQWCVVAGPLRSRAAKAIGFIDDMINYSTANAPLPKELDACEWVDHYLSWIMQMRISSIIEGIVSSSSYLSN